MGDRFFLSIWLLERPWAMWFINAAMLALMAWPASGPLSFFRWLFAVASVAFIVRGVFAYLRRKEAQNLDVELHDGRKTPD